MRWIVGGHAIKDRAAATSQMGSFETELLATDENFAAFTEISGTWVDKVVMDARRVVEEETDVWATQFAASMSLLEKLLTTRTEASQQKVDEERKANEERRKARAAPKVNGVKVRIQNHDKLQGAITVTLGELKQRRDLPTNVVVFPLVPCGQYEGASLRKNGCGRSGGYRRLDRNQSWRPGRGDFHGDLNNAGQKHVIDMISVAYFDLGETLVTQNHQWVEGAQATLEELRQRGLRLGIISDTGRFTRDELASRLPLDFDFGKFEEPFILLSSEIGVQKPERAIFLTAVQRAGVPPSSVVFCTEDGRHAPAAQLVGFYT